MSSSEEEYETLSGLILRRPVPKRKLTKIREKCDKTTLLISSDIEDNEEVVVSKCDEWEDINEEVMNKNNYIEGSPQSSGQMSNEIEISDNNNKTGIERSAQGSGQKSNKNKDKRKRRSYTLDFKIEVID